MLCFFNSAFKHYMTIFVYWSIISVHDNRATADVAQSESFQDAILPIALVVTEHLNIKVINYYAPGYELSLSDREPRKESEEATTASTVYEKGLITKNEGRRRIGEEPVAGADKFMDGTAVGEEAEELKASDNAVYGVNLKSVDSNNISSKISNHTQRAAVIKGRAKQSEKDCKFLQLSLF